MSTSISCRSQDKYTRCYIEVIDNILNTCPIDTFFVMLAEDCPVDKKIINSYYSGIDNVIWKCPDAPGQIFYLNKIEEKKSETGKWGKLENVAEIIVGEADYNALDRTIVFYPLPTIYFFTEKKKKFIFLLKSQRY